MVEKVAQTEKEKLDEENFRRIRGVVESLCTRTLGIISQPFYDPHYEFEIELNNACSLIGLDIEYIPYGRSYYRGQIATLIFLIRETQKGKPSKHIVDFLLKSELAMKIAKAVASHGNGIGLDELAKVVEVKKEVLEKDGKDDIILKMFNAKLITGDRDRFRFHQTTLLEKVLEIAKNIQR